MPKETIIGDDDRRVIVGWERDRDVQLAVTTPGERSVFWQLLAGMQDGVTPTVTVHRRVMELAERMQQTLDENPLLGSGDRHSGDCSGDSVARCNAHGLCDQHELERQAALDVRGQAILNALDVLAFAGPSDGRPGAAGLGSLWFDINDRRTVNDLIRKLRHARDQAFGRDA